MNKVYFGIDIGATSIKSALVNYQGEIVSPITSTLVNNQTTAKQLTAALQKNLQAGQNFAQKNKMMIQGVGVGSPGPLDGKAGVILESANFALIKNFSIFEALAYSIQKNSTNFLYKKDLSNLFLENDASCAALGQFRFGKHEAIDNMLVYTLGTGVGGGFIYQGKLFKGFQGNAFEIGHTSVPALALLYKDKSLDFENITCGCGAVNCLETFSSASGMLKRYQSFNKKENPIDLTVKTLAQQAQQGEPMAQTIFKMAGLMLGHSVVDAVHLINAEKVIFTGGLVGAKNLLQPFIEQVIKERMFDVFAKRLQLEFVEAQEQSGIRGAAALAMESQ